MVKSLEREKDALAARVKEMQRQLDESRRHDRQPDFSSGIYKMNATDQDVLRVKDQRIEELEEALRESVSITAERELAIAQQKQLAQQMEQRVSAA